MMVAAAAVIEHVGTGDLLLLRRSVDRDFAPKMWEDISGRFRQGKDAVEALYREVLEETGISDLDLVAPTTSLPLPPRASPARLRADRHHVLVPHGAALRRPVLRVHRLQVAASGGSTSPS